MELTNTPPDGGWGWMVVLGAALINMVNQGLFSIFGLIFGEKLKDMADGKATGITLVMAINVMVTNFSGLAVAAILKKLSIRTVTFIGIFCVGTGMILSSFATEILHIVLAYGCLTGFGLGLLASATFLIITKYFTKRKSTAVSFAMAGTSIGQMSLPILVGLLLETYQFDGTTRVLGVLSYTGFIGAFLFKPIWCCKRSNASENVEAGDQVDNEETRKIVPVNLKISTEQLSKMERDDITVIKEEDVEDDVEVRNHNQDDVRNNNVTNDDNRFLRPPSTNPFEDSEDSDSEVGRINSRYIRPPSTNPFGSSSEDEREEIVQNEELNKESKQIFNQINGLVAGSAKSIDSEKERHQIINQLVNDPSANSVSSDISDDDISTEETKFSKDNKEDEDPKQDIDLRNNSIETLGRPPSTNPFGSYSDISEAEEVDPELQAEKQRLFNDISNLTKSLDEDLDNLKPKNPFGSMDNMLDVKKTRDNVISPQPFKRQFGKKMVYNPFGSVDELQVNKQPTPKKKFKLFVDDKSKSNDNDEDDEQTEQDQLLDNISNKKPPPCIKAPNLQSGSIDIHPTGCSKICRSLGFRLLKDLKFIHLLVGLAFGYVSSVTFSTFFPMFLQDEAKFTIMQTTTCMTALSFADIAGRLTISEISRKLNLTNRTVFISGAVVLGVTRSLLVYMTEYKMILGFSFIVGYCRAATVITQNLVVSDYIGNEDLPAAVGLNMVTKGVFVLTFGQALGWLKSTLSYAWCIHILDIILYVVAITWSLEILWTRYVSRKTSK